MLIDFHTHIFPEKIASRAIQNLSLRAGGAVPYYDGTKEGLLACMREKNIDKSVVLSIATNPGQMRSVNDFAASVNGGSLISFGSVHPDAPDALDELQRICDLGMKGIKLHPDYQEFYGDDPKMWPIYEKAAKLGLIVVFHTGVDIGLYPPVYMTPRRLANALAPLEGAVVVAAHFGGYMMWEEAIECIAGRDIYLDTAYSAGSIPPGIVRQIVKEHGTGRILFGSDLPWSDPVEEARLLKTLDLSKEELEDIFCRNAQRILNT